MDTKNKHLEEATVTKTESSFSDISSSSESTATADKNSLTTDSLNQNKTPFSVVEAYKNIRVHLLTSLSSINGKSIVISSPYASEGKSTTAINIAITISHLNKKTLLIDADFRRSTLHKKLKIHNEKGCTDVILGESQLEDVIKSHNNYLDILTAGSAVSNPSELFSSLDFDVLLAKARDKYDYIVIDTPPINLVSDTMVIAQKCDGLVIIARAGTTTYEAFKSALDTAKSLNINILGTVLNGVDRNYNKYYRYRYNRHNKKYGKYGYYSRY